MGNMSSGLATCLLMIRYAMFIAQSWKLISLSPKSHPLDQPTFLNSQLVRWFYGTYAHDFYRSFL